MRPSPTRVASLYLEASSLKRWVKVLFEPVEPFVKSYDRFVDALDKMVRSDPQDFVQFKDGVVFDGPTGKIETDTFERDLSRGSRDPRNWESEEVEYAKKWDDVLEVSMLTAPWVEQLARKMASHISDPRGFKQAVLQIFFDRSSHKSLLKLIGDTLQGMLRQDDSEIADVVEDQARWVNSEYGPGTDIKPKAMARSQGRATGRFQGQSMTFRLPMRFEVVEVEHA